MATGWEVASIGNTALSDDGWGVASIGDKKKDDWSVLQIGREALPPIVEPSSFEVGGTKTANVQADIARGPTLEELKNSAMRGWEVASIPGQKSREGLKLLTDMIPDAKVASAPMVPSVNADQFSVVSPTDAGNTPADAQGWTPVGSMLAGVPKTLTEIGSEFAASTIDPASIALMGAGKAVSPILPKASAALDALTTKHTPTLKKMFTYRFGVDGKFQELDDARVKAIGDAIDKANELGKELSEGVSKTEQLRLGQILKGSVSTSEAEAPLRALATNARGTLDEMEKKAVDLGLIPKNALNKYTNAELAAMRNKQALIDDAADRLETKGAFPQKEAIISKAKKIDVVGKTGQATKLKNVDDRITQFKVVMEELKDNLSAQEFQGFEEIMAREDIRRSKGLQRVLTRFEKGSLGEQEMIFARLKRMADGLGLQVGKINPEDLSVSHVQGLIKKIERASGRFPGQTKLVRALRERSSELQNNIVKSYTSSGEKYVPRLYRVFENPKKYEIENANLPIINDMGKGQSAAFTELPQEQAQRVMDFAGKGKSTPVGIGSNVKIGGERFKARIADDDIYRRALGEIKEPAYPVAKGVSQVGRDIANAKFFQAISKETDWVSETVKAGYKEIPSDQKKYGALAGKFLKKNLADELEHTFKTKGPIQEIYEDLLGKWKFGKVIVNPSTHVRNMVSNSVMLDLSGVDFHKQPRLLIRAADNMLNKGKYFQEAKTQTNLLGNEFFGGEIKQFRDALFVTADDGFIDKALNLTRKMANSAGKVYQGEEQVYKLAKYIHAREQGSTVKQAANEAEKWLFNYNKVSPFVDAVRKAPLGSPFFTYTSKALPRVLETAVKDPMRLYKYDLVFNAVEHVSKEKTGLSDEDFDTVKRTAPGQTLVLPFKDEDGATMTLDLTYMLPWGDIGESGGLFKLPPTLSPGGPLKSVLDVGYNKSTFKAGKTGSGEIYNTTDSDGEKVSKIIDYMGKALLPSLTPGIPADGSFWKGGYSFQKLANAIEKKPDYFGRVRNLGLVALDTLAGIKISPVDPSEKKTFEALDKKKMIEMLRINTIKILRHPGVSDEYKDKIRKELRGKIDDILGVKETTPKAENVKEKEELLRLPKGNLSAAGLPTPFRPANLPPLGRDVIVYKDGVEKYLNGDFEGAEKSFKAALRINPKRKEAERALERLYVMRSRGRSK